MKKIIMDKNILTDRKASIIDIQKDRIVIDADVTAIDKVYFSKKKVSSRFRDFKEPINEKLLGFQEKNGYIPYPFTIRKGVYKAPPGLRTIMTDKVEFLPGKTLKIASKADPGDFRARFESILERFDQEMVSSFSAGFDSLLLTHLYRDQVTEILHFSVDGTDVDQFKTVLPDVPWKIVDSDVRFNEKDKADYFAAIDEPNCDTAGFAEFIMTKGLQGIILNGQGADGTFINVRELYKEHVSRINKLNLRTPKSVKKTWIGQKVHSYTTDTRTRFMEMLERYSRLPEPYRTKVLDLYRIYDENIDNDRINFLGFISTVLLYSLCGIEKIRTAARANKVRYYLPFMNESVIDLAMDIPGPEKVGFKVGKKVLRKAYPEIGRMRFVSQSFIPRRLQDRFLGKKRQGTNYQEYFISEYLHS